MKYVSYMDCLICKEPRTPYHRFNKPNIISLFCLNKACWKYQKPTKAWRKTIGYAPPPQEIEIEIKSPLDK